MKHPTNVRGSTRIGFRMTLLKEYEHRRIVCTLVCTTAATPVLGALSLSLWEALYIFTAHTFFWGINFKPTTITRVWYMCIKYSYVVGPVNFYDHFR